MLLSGHLISWDAALQRGAAPNNARAFRSLISNFRADPDICFPQERAAMFLEAADGRDPPLI